VTTALQRYTSALVTSSFEVLSYEEFIPTNINVAIRIEVPERLRYMQSIITNDQIWDTSIWKNISALECAQYGKIQTDTSTLLIVVKDTPGQGFMYQDARLVPYDSQVHPHSFQSDLQHALYPTYNVQEKDWANTSQWHTRISYCLSRKVPGRSRLQVHFWLLTTATVLNAIKLGCLLYTFREQQMTPLVTTGDAIASFLTSPCVHSAGKCLLSQEELVRNLNERRDDDEVDATPTYKRFELRQLRYCRSISLSRWIVYVSSYEHS
jgi:hypothetical protein